MHFDDGSNPWIHSENYVQGFKFGNSASPVFCNAAGSFFTFLVYYICIQIALAGWILLQGNSAFLGKMIISVLCV